MVTYYSLNDEFVAVVSKHGSDADIKVGNPTQLQMPCVQLTVSESDIHIENVSFHVDCSIHEDLKNGSDGTVYMVKLALTFVKYLYPHVTTVKLQDSSGYVDTITRQSTSLPDRDMFLYKMTWYQRKFTELNFEPDRLREKKVLEKVLSVVNRKPTKAVCKELGIAMAETLFDSIQQIHKNHQYDKIRDIFLYYELPSLMNMSWIGHITCANPFELVATFTKIRKPIGLKVQWGRGWGEAGEPHFHRVTWINN
jgi:hypothetical protein